MRLSLVLRLMVGEEVWIETRNILAEVTGIQEDITEEVMIQI